MFIVTCVVLQKREDWSGVGGHGGLGGHVLEQGALRVTERFS